MQDDAEFTDIIHTSTVGIWKTSVGHIDFWVNGGKSQPPGGVIKNSHKAAVYYYERSIGLYRGSGNCSFLAFDCTDSNGSAFNWQE